MNGREQIVERLLLHLQREADDPRLRELAGDVLGGRVGLTEAVASAAYAEATADVVDAYRRWCSVPGPGERDEQALRAEAVIRRLDQEPDRAF
ncbi:hypothetical protein [Actinoplanes couchii]|uniref:MftR C-terminal domain-containing protein n=1 Tax=Actinoplanes couchii TaxID=403638 RepID=A0ABQ3X1V9_9ACTN|nr:hypothetical protein [Actinoplanes couchii]MDR6316841.1 hypothetical protein [Actinoplanes couchii]GID52448.1 hypothetical protein Aco03nite_008520 [Actinoplanes couchii]